MAKRKAQTSAKPRSGTKTRSKVKRAKPTGHRNTHAKSKQAAVVALLNRPQGATVAAVIAATGWQSHSVRGFLAGVVRKKLGAEPAIREDGWRASLLLDSSRRRPDHAATVGGCRGGRGRDRARAVVIGRRAAAALAIRVRTPSSGEPDRRPVAADAAVTAMAAFTVAARLRPAVSGGNLRRIRRARGLNQLSFFAFGLIPPCSSEQEYEINRLIDR
jgi:hypothetical protein